jgi:hypothetical protein
VYAILYQTEKGTSILSKWEHQQKNAIKNDDGDARHVVNGQRYKERADTLIGKTTMMAFILRKKMKTIFVMRIATANWAGQFVKQIGQANLTHK